MGEWRIGFPVCFGVVGRGRFRGRCGRERHRQRLRRVTTSVSTINSANPIPDVDAALSAGDGQVTGEA